MGCKNKKFLFAKKWVGKLSENIPDTGILEPYKYPLLPLLYRIIHQVIAFTTHIKSISNIISVPMQGANYIPCCIQVSICQYSPCMWTLKGKGINISLEPGDRYFLMVHLQDLYHPLQKDHLIRQFQFKPFYLVRLHKNIFMLIIQEAANLIFS